MPTSSIPENVRVLWPSSASTPSGWTTDSNFNDRFPYGSSSGSSNGGSDNHSHNGNNHSHGGSSHTHSVNWSGANGGWPGNECNIYYNHPNNTGSSGRQAVHTHGGNSGSGSTNSSSNASNGFNSGSTIPPYYAFRVIKSNGAGEGFPANSVVLWNTASNPTSESGWSQHSGSVGKFVRGGSNGGGTGGGSHSHTGNSHSHSGGGGSHTHSGPTAAPSGGQPAANNCGSGTNTYPQGGWHAAFANHTHGAPSLASGTQPGGTGNSSSGNSGGTTYEPAYYSVWGVTNSSDSWLEGGIGFLCGESVPDDWVLCDGSNSTPNLNASKLIKLSSSGGSITSGGGTSHNHGSPGSHGHNASGSHSHSVGTLGNQNQVNDTTNQGSNTSIGAEWYGPQPWQARAAWHAQDAIHTHPGGSVSNAGGGFGSATNGIASNSSHPAYRQVQWIMAPEEPSAGGNVGMYGAAF